MKSTPTKILIAALLVLAVLSGYNYFQKPFLKRFLSTQEQPAEETTEQVDPVMAALAEMPARGKILQMMAYPVVLGSNEASISAEAAWVQENQPGMVTIFGNGITMEQATEFTGEVTASAQQYAPLIAVDHEGGSVQRLRGAGFTALPSWRQECAMESADRKELLESSAAELAEAGINIVFAPVLDVAQPGSFLGTRACLTEEDTVLAATDFVTSFARYGILPVVKHFPGIGSITNDLHFSLDTVSLTATDTRPFDDILSAFPNVGVMATHVVVEDRTDGKPCSLSATCLQPFASVFVQALLFTDALEMESASLEENLETPKTLTQVTEEAVRAGNHVLVFGETVDSATVEEVADDLAALYETDELFAKRVDDSVRRILSLKLPMQETQNGEQ